MTTRRVKEELKQMARAGMVVLENDTVACGQRPRQGTGHRDAASTSGGVGGSGDTRVGKRTRATRPEADGNKEGRGGDAGEVEGEGSAGDAAQAESRRRKRRCVRPVYVESEQESADKPSLKGTGGDWGLQDRWVGCGRRGAPRGHTWGQVRATHGWSTTDRTGEPTHERAGRGGSCRGATYSKIVPRREEEWRRDVSHPDFGTASLRGMSKTPTMRSRAWDSLLGTRWIAI